LPTCGHEQDVDLQKFDIKFDVYYLESSLYVDGKVDAVVNGFIASGKTYEKDGALWLAHHRLRRRQGPVIRKSDGTYTTTSYRMWRTMSPSGSVVSPV